MRTRLYKKRDSIEHWRKGISIFPKEQTYEEYMKKINKHANRIKKKM